MADLIVEDLVVEFRSGDYVLRPVDEVSVQWQAGSLVLLLGPSGCGKTTLLSCLGGMLTPTSGTIRLGDTEVTSLAGSELTAYRRDQVGFVFQAFNLIPSLDALDNVLVPLRNARVPRAERRGRAMELLERVGLADRAHHRPADLSGGQQQRVAIARALALDPPLILADEPTAHLDYIQVEETLTLIRSLASEQRIVVVSTHDERMIPLADVVFEMVPRFLEDQGEPEAVTLGAGEILFEQGSWGSLVYLVDHGEIDIVRLHASGDTEVLTTLGPGSYFGETGPMFGLQRSARAQARSEARVVGYPLRSFREQVARHRANGAGTGNDDEGVLSSATGT